MNKKVLTLLVAGFPLLAFGQVEQEQDSIKTYNIDEFEVLSKRRIPLQEQEVGLLNLDVPIKYLPMTVTKLDRATLERKHILNMEDAVKFLPGVIKSSNQLGAFDRYSLRGTADAVFMYDGIRDERTLLNTAPFGDLSAVESIEVIKGAATVLAGHSAMGGVINIIRKKPSERFTANASVSYGSWDQKEATVGFGGKLAGPINYRANIHYSNGDGYREVNADRFSGLFTVGSKITEKGYLEASVNFCDDDYTVDIGGAPTMPGDIYYTKNNELYLPSGVRNPLCDYEDVYGDNANNQMRRRNVDVQVNYTHELTSWMKLRERFGFTHSNLDYSCVEKMSYMTSEDPIYDYYYKTNKGKTVYINLDSVKMDNPLCFNPDHKLYTNTLELTGKLFTKEIEHNYTLGWYYSFFDFTQYNGYNDGDVWGPGLNEVIPVQNPPSSVRDWWDSKVSEARISRQLVNAIYLTDVISINDHWKAMASGRFDLYNYRSAKATIDDGRQEYKEENRSEWSKLNTGAFTYRLGLVYLPIEEISIYASAGNFYKPYTTFSSPNTIYYDKNGHEFNPDADANAYRPQRGNQFELGARYEINRLFDINASVFYSTKHNIVRSLGTQDVTENGTVTAYNVVGQVGKEASKGFDFDITVRPVSTLQIVAGIGWSDYRTKASNLDGLKDNPNINFNYNEDGTVNLRQTGVPRTTFYTYADYTIPKGIFKDLSFHLSGTFTDRIYRNLDNNVYDPARYVVDLGVFYTIKDHITLACNINNLFNNHYFYSDTKLAKPRNFVATVSYHF